MENGNPVSARTGTALLIIDVQQGLFHKPTPIYKAKELLQNITALVGKARRAGVPVYYIQHSGKGGLEKGSGGWELHPQLPPIDEDHIIHKEHGNAFEETILEDVLASENIGTLVMAGLVTHGCVKSTCLGAKELGYQVTLVKDAHSNFSQTASQVIEKWNRILGKEGISLKAAAEIEFTTK